MRIAICDDNVEICKQLEIWIKDYAKNESLDVQINTYYRADKLLEHLEQKQWYDVIFLDIEFPDKNGNGLFDKQGIKLGKHLRQSVECNEVIIDFISGRHEYSMQLFELQPINFRVKPIMKEQIIEDLEKACRILNKKKVALKYEQDNVVKGVLLKNVLYVEACDKSIIIHTMDGKEIVFRGTLEKIEREYKKYNLCRCHRSYIVNLHFVYKYKNHTLTLRGKNDVTLDVGKRYVSELKEALSQMDFQEG